MAEQKMGEEQMQNLYGNVLEATFLISSEVGVHVRTEEVRKLLLHKLGSCKSEGLLFTLSEMFYVTELKAKRNVHSQEMNTYQTLEGLRC